MQNGSKTSQGPISGHISSFRAISANLWKIEFLAKMAILVIFTIFWIFTIWSIICPGGSKNGIWGKKWLLGSPKALLNALNDDFWWLEQFLKITKNHHFFKFPFWGARNDKKWQKNDFYKFLNFQDMSNYLSRCIQKMWSGKENASQVCPDAFKCLEWWFLMVRTTFKK